MRGERMSTYAHRSKAEAFDNAVDVVELLLVPTDQARTYGTSMFSTRLAR